MQCHCLSRLEVPGIVGFYLMWLESSTFSRDNSKTVPTLLWCAMSRKSHPWKVMTGTAGTQEWRFGKSCLFSNWRLSSSMLFFEGVIESVAQTRGNMFMSLYPSYSSWSPTVETMRKQGKGACCKQANTDIHQAQRRWWFTFALMQLRNRFNTLPTKKK